MMWMLSTLTVLMMMMTIKMFCKYSLLADFDTHKCFMRP